MNYLKQIGIVSLLGLFIAMTSCSSDSSNGGSTPSAGITCKVDGTSVTATTMDASLYTNTVAGGRYIDVYAYQGSDQILEFHFPPKTGDYPANQTMDMSNSWLTYMTNNGTNYPADYFNSTSGMIHVTTCDTIHNKIIATFNFVGDNGTVTKNITEGGINLTEITHQ
jgi:hypothetical protein